MKIALVSDIHSNHIALEAVLEDIEKENPDEVFFLGDYVFGGSGSCEAVDMLRAFSACPALFIRGNKEDYIGPIEENSPRMIPELFGIYAELGPERIQWLKSLPARMTVERAGKRLLLCHSPSNLKMFTVVDRLDRKNNPPNLPALQELSRTMSEDVCIFGHYHLYMNETVNGKTFVCTSAVGMPFTGDVRAQYVMLDILDGEMSFELRCAEYDRLAMITDFEKKGYFEKYGAWARSTAVSMAFGKNYIGTADGEK